GASIAFHLAQKRCRVVVLEKGDLACGSSGACDGTIFLQTKKPGIHLRLAIESRKRFDDLKDELPYNIEYTDNGGMVVIETEAEYKAMQLFVQDQKKIGLNVTLLDTKQVREAEPYLDEHLLGAAYCPMDGQVNPIALTLGFGLAAKKLGADIYPNTCVTGMVVKGNRIRTVQSSQGQFEAEVVVNAAGVHASEIAKMAGLDVPITPRRGQLMVTEAVPMILRHVLISAKYIAAKYNPDLALKDGEGASIEQTLNGNLLLGSTREFAGYDKRTTVKKLRMIAERTSKILPYLKKTSVIRAFAGLRPYTPDGYPILGPVKGLEGFIIAAGHEGDGIALAPITGEIIARSIVRGQADSILSEFRLERFYPPSASSEIK
ncbi:MAG: hypothetical protein A2V65_04965, partial [Deltaproteobacteria bacterium RBG_13_49_15]